MSTCTYPEHNGTLALNPLANAPDKTRYTCSRCGLACAKGASKCDTCREALEIIRCARRAAGAQ